MIVFEIHRDGQELRLADLAREPDQIRGDGFMRAVRKNIVNVSKFVIQKDGK